MDEKEISSFIKNRIKEYPFEEIKKYLLEKGVTTEQIDATMGSLVMHPRKNRADILLLGFFSVTVAICILILIPQLKDFTSAVSKRPPSDIIFRGMGGFKLSLPANYKFNRRRDKGSFETVTFYPGSLSFKSLTERKKGVYRLNVISRQTVLSGKPLDLDTMQKNHIALAKKRNLKFKLTKAKDLPFPAFVMKAYSPDKYSEIVMEGAQNIYIFTSAYEDDTFNSIIASLEEY